MSNADQFPYPLPPPASGDWMFATIQPSIAGTGGGPFSVSVDPSFSIALSPGVEANINQIHIDDNDAVFNDVPYDLTFGYGDSSITLKQLYIDHYEQPQGPDGLNVGIRIMDRRWRWKFNQISYQTNCPDISGNPTYQTTARDIVAKCLTQLKETIFDVSKVTDQWYPQINWIAANTAQEMQNILSQCGCTCVLQPDNNNIEIVKDGIGYPLPDFPYESIEPGIERVHKPTVYCVRGGRTLIQKMCHRLDPVLQDIDGQWKKLRHLSFAPKPKMRYGGFEAHLHPLQMDGQNPDFIMGLVDKYLWKAYRLPDSHRTIGFQTVEGSRGYAIDHLCEAYQDGTQKKFRSPIPIIQNSLLYYHTLEYIPEHMNYREIGTFDAENGIFLSTGDIKKLVIFPSQNTHADEEQGDFTEPDYDSSKIEDYKGRGAYIKPGVLILYYAIESRDPHAEWQPSVPDPNDPLGPPEAPNTVVNVRTTDFYYRTYPLVTGQENPPATYANGIPIPAGESFDPSMQWCEMIHEEHLCLRLIRADNDDDYKTPGTNTLADAFSPTGLTVPGSRTAPTFVGTPVPPTKTGDLIMAYGPDQINVWAQNKQELDAWADSVLQQYAAQQSLIQQHTGVHDGIISARFDGLIKHINWSMDGQKGPTTEIQVSTEKPREGAIPYHEKALRNEVHRATDLSDRRTRKGPRLRKGRKARERYHIHRRGTNIQKCYYPTKEEQVAQGWILDSDPDPEPIPPHAIIEDQLLSIFLENGSVWVNKPGNSNRVYVNMERYIEPGQTFLAFTAGGKLKVLCDLQGFANQAVGAFLTAGFDWKLQLVYKITDMRIVDKVMVHLVDDDGNPTGGTTPSQSYAVVEFR